MLLRFVNLFMLTWLGVHVFDSLFGTIKSFFENQWYNMPFSIFLSVKHR